MMKSGLLLLAFICIAPSFGYRFRKINRNAESVDLDRMDLGEARNDEETRREFNADQMELRRNNKRDFRSSYYERMLRRADFGQERRRDSFIDYRREMMTFCQPQSSYSRVCCPSGHRNVGSAMTSPKMVPYQICERQGVDGNCQVKIVTKYKYSQYHLESTGEECVSHQNYKVVTMDI